MLKLHDTRVLLWLAIPLIISGLIEASIGFTSTIFLAHIGTQYLAAGALVAWFFATMMVIMWGLFTAVSVSVANRQGAQDEKGIAYVVRDSFWLAILLSIPIMILVWNMAPILHVLGQKHSLILMAVPYLHALAWSIIPDFTGLMLIQVVMGLGHMRTNLAFTISWVILNILANYVFIFGKLGFAPMGIAGLGWGTTLSFWVTTIAWFIYMIARKCYRPYFQELFSFKPPYYHWELLRVGVPTGLMWCIEIVFFFVMVLLIGHMGTLQLAAAQISMQYVGLFVSVLFSISRAVTVRVSNRLGAEQYNAMHNATHSGLFIAVIIMLVLACVAWVAPHYLIALDLNPSIPKNAEVSHLAAVYLAIGMGALLAEAIRIPLFGALRGLKDTQTPLLASFLGFWVVAIPVGLLCAYVFHLGAIGFWWGFLAGVILSAVFLLWRYQRAIQRFSN